MSELTQEQIERHNRRELWRDVDNHLRVAVESIAQAQSGLEDLGRSRVSNYLNPIVEGINHVRQTAGTNLNA